MKTKDAMIREFRMTDFQNVITLWEEAGIHYKPKGRESRPQMAGELNGQSVFLVAEADKRIVGVVLGTHDGRKGWINRLAVAKTSAVKTSLQNWLPPWKID